METLKFIACIIILVVTSKNNFVYTLLKEKEIGKINYATTYLSPVHGNCTTHTTKSLRLDEIICAHNTFLVGLSSKITGTLNYECCQLIIDKTNEFLSESSEFLEYEDWKTQEAFDHFLYGFNVRGFHCSDDLW
jgi:hypothetical protein